MKMKRMFLSLTCCMAMAVAAVAAAGCSSVSQAINAYGAVAVSGAKAANDTLIEANKTALCATPVSALVRHPELVPAVRSLCLVGGDKGNAGQVLEAIAQTTPIPTQ